MPLFYVDTYDGIAVLDDVGTELPDLAAAREHVRLVLTKMMNDEACDGGSSLCRADVRDASGRRVLEASLVLTLSPTPDAAP